MPTPQQTTAMSEKLQNNFEQFKFELNDATTREAITQSYYDLLNADIDIQNFNVLCDDTNNTVERVNAGEFFLDIAVMHNGDKGFTYYPIRVIQAPAETAHVEGDSN